MPSVDSLQRVSSTRVPSKRTYRLTPKPNMLRSERLRLKELEENTPIHLRGVLSDERRKEIHAQQDAQLGDQRKFENPSGSYGLPDFDSDSDDSQDEDQPPAKKSCKRVHFSDEVASKPEPVQPYNGNIARQPDVIQSNINQGRAPLAPYQHQFTPKKSSSLRKVETLSPLISEKENLEHFEIPIGVDLGIFGVEVMQAVSQYI